MEFGCPGSNPDWGNFSVRAANDLSRANDGVVVAAVTGDGDTDDVTNMASRSLRSICQAWSDESGPRTADDRSRGDSATFWPPRSANPNLIRCCCCCCCCQWSQASSALNLIEMYWCCLLFNFRLPIHALAGKMYQSQSRAFSFSCAGKMHTSCHFKRNYSLLVTSGYQFIIV